MENFKIRASAAGKIMGVRGLGQTGKTFVNDWLIEQLFNRKKMFSNKYTQKGIQNESDSIDMLAELLGYGMLSKNEKHFANEYATGTPDVVLSDCVIDVKNSWDPWTFPFFADEVPNKDYELQLQVYMELLNVDRARLVYTLTDTPAHLIESEARKYCFSNGYDPADADVYEDFAGRMTYPDIPAEQRIKVFEIERNPETWSKIVERVQECRKLISNNKRVAAFATK